MRLISTATIQLAEYQDDEVANLKYAILSHRWNVEEVSFQEMLKPTEDTKRKQGYTKIEKFCKRAYDDGFKYAWVDICCINKESSAELSESLNSMFRWYRQAGKCYAFLADVGVDGLDDLLQSEWFTRGWTLQELIAPRVVVFLAQDWSEIDTKHDLASRISQTMRIDKALLLGEKMLDQFCVAKRMSWATGRKTTRTEDRAYSLMGIFNVNMPLLYGEGDNAFVRLQEEIMKDSNDETLFAWEMDGVSDDEPCGLLAPSPDCFANSADIMPYSLSQGGLPFILTNRGIRMQSPILSRSGFPTALILQCVANSALVGIGVRLKSTMATEDHFVRVTKTVLRDIPPLSLRFLTLETAYVVKSFLAASSERHAVRSQNQDGSSGSEHNLHLPDFQFHRRVKPRGQFKKIILFFDDTQCFCDTFRGSFSKSSNLKSLHDMLYLADGSQITYFASLKQGSVSSLKHMITGAYRFLIKKNHQIGDEINLFGFGRGCHAAATLCEILEYVGILLRYYPQTMHEIWDALSTKGRNEGVLFMQVIGIGAMPNSRWMTARFPRIQFVGFFDAVQIRTWMDQSSTAMISLPAHVIRHAISTDEKRSRLRPTGVQKHVHQTSTSGPSYYRTHETRSWVDQSLQQMWFKGTHQDMKGTTKNPNSIYTEVSLMPRLWMAVEADMAGLQLDPNFDWNLLFSDWERSNESVTELIRPLAKPSRLYAILERLDVRVSLVPFLARHFRKKSKEILHSTVFDLLADLRGGQREIPSDAAVHSDVLAEIRKNPNYPPAKRCTEDLDSLTILNQGDVFREYFLWKPRERGCS